MKSFRIFLLLLLTAALPLAAQIEDQKPLTERAFYLIPLLETAFSGELAWRPDWPADIPPDAFSLPAAGKIPMSITLSNSAEDINFIRNTEGRIAEFPFFLRSPENSSAIGHVQTEVNYADSGAILSMTVTGETSWKIEFPADFFPYSEFSPGGSFPPITVILDEEVFFVFIFESPGFLTETWYDKDGNILTFLRANVIREDQNWRIRLLQIRDTEGFYEEERFYDSGGNISEIRSQEEVFSALYRNGRPDYRQYQQDIYDLHWDTRGFLTLAKNIKGKPEPGFPVEYRYEYETDLTGNWIKRYEIAIINVLNVFAPQPPLPQKIWSRKIGFLEK